MGTEKIFTPLTLGGKNDPIVLKHRVVMAPLTRLKSDAKGVHSKLAATYYSQRATDGGLIIAEATDVSETAHGYHGAPGIYSDDHITAWKEINDAVHQKNGKMFLQIWHTGRRSHPLNQPHGQLPTSSSSVIGDTSRSLVPTPDGRKAPVVPRALETNEIPGIVQDFKKAAQNAITAGFDGIEIHAANGYLFEQFLQDGINGRTDKYGGSIENRARFLFESLDAILEVVDSSRVGIRLSPFGMSFSQGDSNPVEHYGYVLKKLGTYDLAYVHLIEPRSFPGHENLNAPAGGITAVFRPLYSGVLLTASGYDRDSAVRVVGDGDADLVAFGRYFISNPDLVKRLQLSAPLNPYDVKTFYLPGAEGYTDQPFFEES